MLKIIIIFAKADRSLPFDSLTVKILYTGIDKLEQIVQIQIRLLLQEQSDQDLHCLSFHFHLLDALLHCKTKLFHFRTLYRNYFRCPIFSLNIFLKISIM